jgi:hypothetical protein
MYFRISLRYMEVAFFRVALRKGKAQETHEGSFQSGNLRDSMALLQKRPLDTLTLVKYHQLCPRRQTSIGVSSTAAAPSFR